MQKYADNIGDFKSILIDSINICRNYVISKNIVIMSEKKRTRKTRKKNIRNLLRR